MKYLHFVVICVTHCIYNKSSAVPELKRRDRKSFHNLKRKGTFLPRRGSKVGGGGSKGGREKERRGDACFSLSVHVYDSREYIGARKESHSGQIESRSINAAHLVNLWKFCARFLPFS